MVLAKVVGKKSREKDDPPTKGKKNWLVPTLRHTYSGNKIQAGAMKRECIILVTNDTQKEIVFPWDYLSIFP